MRRGVVLGASMLSACGRLEFAQLDASGDGTSDAPPSDVLLGHDEDGDGLVDSADPCPHVSGDAADGDNDGVGDACDPRPTTPGDSFILFSTLQPGDHPFTFITGWDQEPDALHYAQVNGTLYIDRFVRNVRIEIGFDIRGFVGTGQRQVAGGIEGVNPFYFVELNENVSQRYAGITSYDATNGYLSLGQQAHSGVHEGRGILRYDAVTTPREFRLVTGWTGELYMATGTTSQYDGGQPVRFTFNGLDLALLYVVLIGSP